MTNNQHRGNYTYLFLGTILKKSPRRNPQYQQHYYQLHISCETNPQIHKIFVFQPKLTNPAIWSTITTGNCLGQRYQFFCRNYQGHYYLVNMVPLAKNGASTQEPSENKQTTNYEKLK